MKQHLLNALYGVLDYAAYPAAMLLAAPILMRTLGANGYGLWAVMTAVISGGAILASGFGDANIQYLSQKRSGQDTASLAPVVRALLGINLTLGGVLAIGVIVTAPHVAAHLVPHDATGQRDCLWSLLLASGQLLIRSAESVCISTQRAFERYGPAVRISIVARVVSVLTGAALTHWIPRITVVLLFGFVLSALATLAQMRQLRKLLHAHTLSPTWDKVAFRSLAGFGIYSWLLAASGVAFAQLDRILLGLWLGGAMLASYALCTQLAQPVNGLISSALHFVFPYLANRSTLHGIAEQRNASWIAVGCNVLLVTLLVALLQFSAPPILSWLGHGGTVSISAQRLFPLVLWSTALLGLGVSPTYVLYAANRVRTVVAFCTVGAVLSVALMPFCIHAWGAIGIVIARVPYVLSALMLYIPMFHMLRVSKRDGQWNAALCEEV